MDAGALVAVVVIALLVAAAALTIVLVVRRPREMAGPASETLRAGEPAAGSAQTAANRAQGANAWTRIGGGGI